VRIMDAQTRVVDSAALAALVQCAVRLEATGGYADGAIAALPEVLEENRFLAARDGMRAELIDPGRDGRRPVRDSLDELLAACAPHAAALGCEAQLAGAAELADAPGDQRQRIIAGVQQGDPVGPALGILVSALAADFSAGPARPRRAAPRPRAGYSRTRG
jgi:glutamate---cysteine ligase / carboxylate-amine ligase